MASAHAQAPYAQLAVPCLTYTLSPPCCVAQRAELQLILASPVGAGRGQWGESRGTGARLGVRKLGLKTRELGAEMWLDQVVRDSAADKPGGAKRLREAEDFQMRMLEARN